MFGPPDHLRGFWCQPLVGVDGVDHSHLVSALLGDRDLVSGGYCFQHRQAVEPALSAQDPQDLREWLGGQEGDSHFFGGLYGNVMRSAERHRASACGEKYSRSRVMTRRAATMVEMEGREFSLFSLWGEFGADLYRLSCSFSYTHSLSCSASALDYIGTFLL